jgi:acetyl esterase/lipase
MRTPGETGREEDPPRQRSPINRFVRAVLGLFAAPRVNMREDYEKVRRFQRQLIAPRSAPPRAVDYEVASEYGDHHIPVRVFHPRQQLRDEVLLFFHGGGWVIGDVDTYTPTCIRMADLTGCVVIAVDYRLAPEHPFPAGLQDCYQVAKQLLADPRPAGIEDADNLVLIGDSAGGNLAAVVSLLLRENDHRSASKQILLYPVTQWDHNPETSPFESVRLHGEGYRLTNAEVRDYFDLYTPDLDRRRDWHVAPLMAEDLTNQPETLVITAELDLLCDEGEAYGHELQNAGNTVRIHRVEGALHGFIALPRISRSVREAYEVITSFLDDKTDENAAPEATV